MDGSEKKIKRTHDALYLDENRYEDPKEMFKFVSSHAFKEKNPNSALEVADFGCAAGEFLYYLQQTYPQLELTGIDILPELIAKATVFNPTVSLKVGSVTDTDCIGQDSFDISFLIGVHSIFEEFETCFSNLINWTRKDGRVYILGMFNPFPIDVMIKYRKATELESGTLESGWNIFSQDSVAKYLNSNSKVKHFGFHKFDIGLDLSPHEDPVRSWTIQDRNQDRMITNGLCILQPHYLLEIVL